jgi:hypothetical protein
MTNRYGTRWGRMLLVLAPALLVIGGLGTMLETGVLATSLVVQSGSLNISADGVYGTNFGAAFLDQAAETSTGSAENIPVLRLGFANGYINGLCMAEPQTIGGLTFTILVHVGDNDPATWETVTQNTVLDLTNVSGELDMDGLVDLNINAPDVTTITNSTGGYVTNPLNAPEGNFGIQAHFAKFDMIQGAVQDIQIPGVLYSDGLSISIESGSASCPTPTAPTTVPPTASGTVTSATSGAAISGATVTLYTSAGASVETVTTNSSGQYTVWGLSPGTTYYVTASAANYVTSGPSSTFTVAYGEPITAPSLQLQP